MTQKQNHNIKISTNIFITAGNAIFTAGRKYLKALRHGAT